MLYLEPKARGHISRGHRLLACAPKEAVTSLDGGTNVTLLSWADVWAEGVKAGAG